MSALTTRFPVDMLAEETPAQAVHRPKPPDPASHEERRWEHPNLISQALLTVPEPVGPTNLETSRAQCRLIARHIDKLQNIKDQLEPHVSEAVSGELCARRFCRELVSWRAFSFDALPVEILIMIFKCVMDPPYTYDGPNQQRTTLTMVCSFWRQVVIQDQSFWCDLWFTGYPPWRPAFLAMERAGGKPLHVRIQDPLRRLTDVVDPPKLSAANIEWLVDRILPKFSQITTFSVVLHRQDTMRAVLQRLSLVSAPNLIIVDMVLGSLQAPGTAQPLPPLFNGEYPKLTRLLLSGVCWDWDSIRGSELTSMDLRYLGTGAPSVTAFRQMLRGCPQLRRLVIDRAAPLHVPQASTPDSIVVLPNLRELLVAHVTAFEAYYLLFQFDAPNLQALVLSTLENECTGIFWLFGQSRRYPLLEDLSLSCLSLSTEEVTKRLLVQWFDGLHKLRSLKLARMHSPVLDALVTDPRQYDREEDGADTPREVLCPKLQAIYLDMQDIELTVPFLKRRAELGVPFKRPFISRRFYDMLNADFRKKLGEAIPGPWYINDMRRGVITAAEHEEAMRF